MRSSDIQIGSTYLARVSGRIVALRVLSKHENFHSRTSHCGTWRDRWVCVNEATGRQVLMKSPQRFMERVES